MATRLAVGVKLLWVAHNEYSLKLFGVEDRELQGSGLHTGTLWVLKTTYIYAYHVPFERGQPIEHNYFMELYIVYQYTQATPPVLGVRNASCKLHAVAPPKTSFLSVRMHELHTEDIPLENTVDERARLVQVHPGSRTEVRRCRLYSATGERPTLPGEVHLLTQPDLRAV